MSYRALVHRLTIVAATATLFGLQASLAAEQDKPGKEVSLDLSADGAVIAGTLPFDVPFQFVGTAEGIEFILYRASEGQETPGPPCQGAVTSSPIDDYLSVEAPDPLSPARPVGKRQQSNAKAKLSRLVGSSADSGGRADEPLIGYEIWTCRSGRCATFRLLVGALEANRFYCFHFLVGRRPADNAIAGAFVRDTIDKWSRDKLQASSDTPTAEGLRRLRIDLLRSLTVAGSARNLAVMTDSPLAGGVRFDALFEPLVRGVLSAQRTTASIDTTLGTDAKASVTDISRWLDSALLTRLIQRVEGNTEAVVTPFAALGSKLRDIGGSALLFEVQGMAETQTGSTTLENKLTSTERAAAVTRQRSNIIVPFELLLRLLNQIQLAQNLRTVLAITPQELMQIPAMAAAIGESLAQIRLMASEIDATREYLAIREKAIADMATAVRVAEGVGLLGSTVGDFSTRKTWYFGMDLGVGYAPKLGTVFPYAGMNIYFTPVNKEAPVNTVGPLKRFALMVGVTYATGQEKIVLSSNTEPVLTDRTFVVGAGYRFIDNARLTAGGLLLRERNKNPLLLQKKLVWTPFLSLSIDWNVKDNFLDKLFGLN